MNHIKETMKALTRAFALLLALTAPAHAETITVPAGGDLQAALTAAKPGDTIVLTAGATYVGEFVLPAKPFGVVITIRSSATLPDRRITPADAALLPTLSSGEIAPALVGDGAANWTLDGIAFASTPTGDGEIIVLQDAQDITLDRILIVAGPDGQKRAIRGNGQHITLTRSHIANIVRAGQDSQSFCAWDGAGPYTLHDNYLEASGENVMFGGSDSASSARMPADILIERNHLAKRPEWRKVKGIVKNLLEFKAATRFVVRHNLLEGNWTDVQDGWAVLITPRNQGGAAPWSGVTDGLIEDNTILDVEHAFNILGHDDEHPAGQTTRITIRRNTVDASGHFLQLGAQVGVVDVSDNDVTNGLNAVKLYTGRKWLVGATAPVPAEWAVEDWTFQGNELTNWNIGGDNVAPGTAAIERYVKVFNGVASPPQVPAPIPEPIVVDASGDGWAFGPNKETLCNGQHMANGFGTEYRLAGGVVEVLGTDANWYRWTGSSWARITVPEPLPDPVAALAGRVASLEAALLKSEAANAALAAKVAAVEVELKQALDYLSKIPSKGKK